MSSSQPDSQNSPFSRDKLAQLVVKWSFSLLTIVAVLAIAAQGLAIWCSRPDVQQLADFSRGVLTLVLPVLGTWVGTVLAFYFARDNFEAASRAFVPGLQNKLEAILAETEMLPFGMIEGIVELGNGTTEKDILIDDLVKSVNKTNVSRVVVVKKDNQGSRPVIYTIHDSIIFRAAADPATVPNSTLEDLLATKLPDGKLIKDLAAAFQVERRKATLGDCQRLMDRVPGCRDVFITEKGERSETPLGWVTDRDIARHARLSGSE